MQIGYMIEHILRHFAKQLQKVNVGFIMYTGLSVQIKQLDPTGHVFVKFYVARLLQLKKFNFV
jgi:hypothetical protein